MSDKTQTPPRQKHDYTSELELKSLLIRVQNWNKFKDKNNLNTVQFDKRFDIPKIDKINNRKITRYIKLFIKLKIKDTAAKKDYYQRVTALRLKLKERIVELSERTIIDKFSYNTFGTIITLMIKNILTKPKFSGYSYRDDFYSDSIHKILKYLHNFNHTLISERSGIEVNAFAYISQIIHNSIIYIIKQKQKESKKIKEVISLEITYGELDLKQNHNNEINNEPKFEEKEFIIIKIPNETKDFNLSDTIDKINKNIESLEKAKKYLIEYPSTYKISFEEYDIIRPKLKGKIDIKRRNDE